MKEYVTIAFKTTFLELQRQTRHIQPDTTRPECIRQHILAMDQVAVMFEPVYKWLLTTARPGSYMMDTDFLRVQAVILENYGVLFTIRCQTDIGMLLKLRYHNQDGFEVETVPED